MRGVSAGVSPGAGAVDKVGVSKNMHMCLQLLVESRCLTCMPDTAVSLAYVLPAGGQRGVCWLRGCSADAAAGRWAQGRLLSKIYCHLCVCCAPCVINAELRQAYRNADVCT